jgi:hypothetical protein
MEYGKAGISKSLLCSLSSNAEEEIVTSACDCSFDESIPTDRGYTDDSTLWDI